MLNDAAAEWSMADGLCRDCGRPRLKCEDCGYFVEACGECASAPGCICDDEPTVEVSLETSPGRVSLARHVELMTGGKR